ncbi:MAG: hypothetical protein SFU83_07265 [Meiothermus sp.]|nr:hypothetical protein [Meiothermus sp.]
MQLDPTTALSPQLAGIGGNKLEMLTASVFASIGYTVFRGLIIEYGGQQAAEIDVFASLMTPFRETRMMVECKGGNLKPQEIRQFASLSVLVDEPPDSLLMVCKHNQKQAILDLAGRLGVSVLERINLTYLTLPILGGANQRDEKTRRLNGYIASQLIYDYLMGYTTQNSLLKDYKRFLLSRLWLEKTPLQQVKTSFDAHQNDFKNVTEQVAKIKNTTALASSMAAQDDEIEGAMFLELLHRVMNVYAICRLAIHCVNREDPNFVVTTPEILPEVRSTITTLSAYPLYLGRFIPFFQNFLFKWGGVLYLPEKGFELERMGAEVGIPGDVAENFLDTIDTLFSSGRKMMHSYPNGLSARIRFFAYVPGAFRGLGYCHRLALDNAKYSQASFFNHDSNYYVALNRALHNVGGYSGLKL